MPLFIVPIISQWQLRVAIATRLLIHLRQKKTIVSFPLPIDAICEIRIDSMASEDISIFIFPIISQWQL